MEKMMINVAKIFLFCLSFWAFKSSAQWLERTQQHMGTLATIRATGVTFAQMNEAFRVIGELDQLLSVYIPHSQVSQLNKQSYLRSAHLDLIELIELSRQVEAETQSAFSITLGALTMEAYQFKELNKKTSLELKAPSDVVIAAALRLTSLKYLSVKGRQIKILRPGLLLDFGGIAKGFAIDRASQKLLTLKELTGSISLSGDIRCFKSCELQILDPLGEGKIKAKLSLRGAQVGVSTSGGYGRFAGSPKYHHLLNPKDGKSVHEFASVTLLGNFKNVYLDAWATAVSVMGTAKGLRFIKKKPGLYYFVIFPNGSFETNLMAHLSKPNSYELFIGN